MATVAEAKNSDEVAQAIEAAALPVGSYRIKRSASFDVSLNAYVGPFWGKETITKGRNMVDEPKQTVRGLTSPVGVAVSFSGRGISKHLRIDYRHRRADRVSLRLG